MNGFGQRTDSFGVLSLDPEVIDGVKVEINHLMSQPVAANRFHDPVVYWHVFVQGVIEDIACDGGGDKKDHAVSKRRQVVHALDQRCSNYSPGGHFRGKNCGNSSTLCSMAI